MTTLWSGRFRAGMHPKLFAFSRSVETDARLATVDLEGSLGHVEALRAAGLLTEGECNDLREGLLKLKALAAHGNLPFRADDEDVHMAVERMLLDVAGPVARKLHTGRSRNDQVATDLHLYVKREGATLAQGFIHLAEVALNAAEIEHGRIVPGLTHLQWAQPVLLSHHLLAYSWMFLRDAERLQAVSRSADRSPLGAGALAGAGLPLDPEVSARVLGLSAVYDNSMDAVADRDFMLEMLSALVIAQVHLSRLAEEVVIWTSQPVGLAAIADDFATGSSMMPQKKNPDAAELIRGKTGQVIGSFVALATLMKGLPMTYNRDLQEDKIALFAAIDTTAACADVASELLPRLSFRDVEIPAGDPLFATDLADHLVELGMPFRQAHEVVGRLVARAEDLGTNLLNVPQDERTAIHPDLADLPPLDAKASVGRRSSPLGTAPDAVARQSERARQRIAELRSFR